MGGQRHAPIPLPQGKRPGTNFIGGWVSPRAAGLVRKIPPPTGIRSRNVQPVESRYIDWASQHLTPCSRVFLQEIKLPPPVNEFPQFVESESSLPYSQQSATCPYTDTDKSCLLPPITFKYLFQQYPRIYDYVSHVVFFLQIPPPKSGMHFFPQTFPTPRTSHHPLFYHFNNIRRRV